MSRNRLNTLVIRGICYVIDCSFLFGIIATTQVFVFVPLRNSIGIDFTWFESGWNTEVYTLATISFPVWVYFILLESKAGTTLGKLFFGFRVTHVSKEKNLDLQRSLLRTAVKLLPWELAHIGNNLPQPIWFSEDPEFRIAFLLAGILMTVQILCVWLSSNNRGLHDWVGRSKVVGPSPSKIP